MLSGAADRINEVLRFKSNMDSGMFLPVQLAAVAALQLDHTWYSEVNKTYTARRKKAIELLALIGCHPAPGQSGLFLWSAIPATDADAYALSDRILYGAGVFITPGGIFGSAGNQYVRISLCATEEKMAEAIQRIKIHGSGN